MSALPQHKTDMIFRVQNLDRYDDRDVIITNLLDSYDRMGEFAKKHLNDPFFKTIIPLNDTATMRLGPTVSDQVSDQVPKDEIEDKILAYCKAARTKKEIAEHIGYKNLTYMTRKFLKPLLEKGRLSYTIPEKPQSRLQKYISKKS